MKYPKVPCHYAGCRAWARLGDIYCARHPGGQLPGRVQKYPKVPCQYAGCKGWARHGDVYCTRHPGGELPGRKQCPKVPCQYPGCRSYARLGDVYCVGHPGGQPGRVRHPKVPCQYPGCRSYARLGDVYCVGHPGGKPPAERHPLTPGAQPGNRNSQKQGLYARDGMFAQVEAVRAAGGDLGDEIAVVRTAISRFLESGVSPTELAVCLDKSTAALIRLLRAQRDMGTPRKDTDESLGQVLKDLGLG